MHIDIAASKNL